MLKPHLLSHPHTWPSLSTPQKWQLLECASTIHIPPGDPHPPGHPAPLPGTHSHQPFTSSLGQEVPVAVLSSPSKLITSLGGLWTPLPQSLLVLLLWFLALSIPHYTYLYVSFPHQTRLHLHKIGTGYFLSVTPEPSKAADAHSRSSIIVWRNDSMNNSPEIWELHSI